MGIELMASIAASSRVVLFALLSTLPAAPLLAQDGKALTYDVVTIRLNNSNPNSVHISIDDDRYHGENVTLKALIQYAYDLKTREQISGLSGWADSTGFDIQAKMDTETAGQLKGLTEKARTEKQRIMMQALLAERFHVTLHYETKELPIYELAIAKGGTKLVSSDPTEEHPNGITWPDGKSHAGNINVRDTDLMAQGIAIDGLAEYLAGRVRRLVIDKTGLTGKYDFTLHSAREGENGASDDAPPLFTALQEQLGLKLESTKGPVDTVVIDSFEKPSEN